MNFAETYSQDTGPTQTEASPTCGDAMLLSSSRLTSSAEDSPAKTSATRGRVLDWWGTALGCGSNSRESLASFDRATLSWRTSQRCLSGDWTPFSGRLPSSGMMRSGQLYELPTLAPRTDESDCLSWPTPTVCGNYNRKGASPTSGDGLDTAVKACGSQGRLNPEWVECLMGFPIGWTDGLPTEAKPNKSGSHRGRSARARCLKALGNAVVPQCAQIVGSIVVGLENRARPEEDR